MILDKELFEKIAEEAAQTPRRSKSFDLRGSEDENSQRMLNVLISGTKTPIHRHQDTSEVVVYIYGSAIECFNDADGDVTEVVKIIVGSNILSVVVEIGRFHSLEATDELGVVCSAKTGLFQSIQENNILKINSISKIRFF